MADPQEGSEEPPHNANEETQDETDHEKLSQQLQESNDSSDKHHVDSSSFRYMNEGGNFFTGIDTTTQEAAEKREKRATRFGLKPVEDDLPSVEKQLARAKRFGTKLVVVNGEPLKLVDSLPEIPNGDLRPEAIHVHGTDEMSTRDIFNYFKMYSPRNIEWINDSSCNVVWEDAESAHRALHGIGRQPVALKEQYEDNQTMEEAPSSEEEKTGNQWRMGAAHLKAKVLLLRYATQLDVKVAGSAKQSKYYLKYGNPNTKKRPTTKRDLRSCLGKRQLGEGEESMEIDEGEGVDDPLAALSKRPKPLHADRSSDMEDDAVPEEEDGDLRSKLHRKRKQKELKLRLGHSPRLVERTSI